MNLSLLLTGTGRWVVLDLLTREVVSESTDGNEQLSVMRYSPGEAPSLRRQTMRPVLYFVV